VTGYPVRHDLFEGDRTESRQRLGLTATNAQGGELPVLLVFGGSQGAHSINQAVCDGVPELLSVAQVVHLTGRRDVEQVRARRDSLPEGAGARYHVYDYLDKEMTDALRAADLVVARAGASTLGELPAAGVPGVLVPYPYAGAHQWANARYLAEAGAAVTVSDSEAGTQLVPTVLGLLADVDRRAAMSRAARAMARPDAAECIAYELSELAL
jgi:UDP-N-acetylglucosamine:LPS N-acetylglucosamine transferase